MIRLICVGKNRDKALKSLEDEYVKRISAFDRVQVEEVKDEPNLHTDREAEERRVRDAEAARVLDRLKADDFVVLLDLHGTMPDSPGFAWKLIQWRQAGHLVFVIAGSLGPGEALVRRAGYRLKLSDLTFTHMMTRVLLLEQIYRGFMIDAGRSYHK
ncbi:23S rRNA (pseudouridine(1915)-N(3))-methyltransferase RlmH [uncultured Faecalibaculum sp.]|uniref:23S rRNA (pseudouridine(1915)-N(3))-methyltransferase RlmH n=1 Tax=uncultured Faecalibaculum sp. TaxID=1729681 RepID=UPI0025FFD3C4|nr:23S rRNA (pseudouridine(1915)-N(3))-methyltransferase RlmH [uncultured Faecalibaculum sp.]